MSDRLVNATLLCNFNPKSVIFYEKSANLETFPLLKMKKGGNFFHIFLSTGGKIILFLAEYSPMCPSVVIAFFKNHIVL